MNFRVTLLFFGILLGMLWLFGLILAVKQTRFEEDYVLPSLHGAPDVDVYAVKIERTIKGKRQTFTFTKSSGQWTMRKDGLTPVVRVMESKIRGIVDQIRSARKNREADVYNDPAKFGLKTPQMTVRLNGRSAKKSSKRDEWVLYVGNESPKKEFVYVNTSDAPDQVFAVRKSELNDLDFKNGNAFRPQQLLSVTEFQVAKISLKQTQLDKAGKISKTSKVALEKKKGDKWELVDPNLGAAEFEGGKPKATTAKQPKTESAGVKGLIAAINDIAVAKTADFVPITDVGLAAYRLDEGSELLRIQVETESNTAKGKTTTVKQTLLIGNPVPKENQYYARLAGDQGVVKIDKDALKPVEKVLNDPGLLRSRRLVFVAKNEIDAVNIRTGKNLQQMVLLRKGVKDGWHVQFDGKYKPVELTVVDALLNKLDDSQAILDFVEDGDTKTLLKEMGLDSPTAVVRIWKDGIAAEKPAKKDKADKKDIKPKPKKDSRFTLQDDAKPVATLSFGKTEGNLVYVKREITGIPTTYVQVDKTALNELAPEQGAIAFLRQTMIDFDKDNVTQIALDLDGKEFLLQRRSENQQKWRMTKQKDFAGRDHVDEIQVTQILGFLEKLKAKKWVEQVDAKTDLAKFGLQKPSLSVSLSLWDGTPNSVATLIGLGSGGSPVAAASNAVAIPDLSKAKEIVYKFGNATDDESKVAGVYATSSENGLLFIAEPGVVSRLRDADPRDRSWLFSLQSVVDATLFGMAMPPTPFDALLPASPLTLNEVHTFAPKDVASVGLKLRTQYLTFNLKFARTKDGWKDGSGLEGFKLNPKTVDEFVKTIAELKPKRFVSLQGPPPSDFKLGDAEASLVVDLKLKNGATVHLNIGSQLAGRGYLASTSQWKGVVFVVSDIDVFRYLRGVGVFSKEP